MPHYPAFFPCLTSVDNLGAITAVSDWLDRASSSGGLTHHGPPLTMNTLLHALIKAYEIQGYFLLRNAFNNVGLDHTIQLKLCLHGRSFMDYWVAGTAMHGCPVACMDGCKPAASVPLRHEHTVGPRKGDACIRAVQFALLTKRGQAGAPTCRHNLDGDFTTPCGVVANLSYFHCPIEVGL